MKQDECGYHVIKYFDYGKIKDVYWHKGLWEYYKSKPLNLFRKWTHLTKIELWHVGKKRGRELIDKMERSEMELPIHIPRQSEQYNANLIQHLL